MSVESNNEAKAWTAWKDAYAAAAYAKAYENAAYSAWLEACAAEADALDEKEARK